ncbi:CD164 sialomucin-like 2 protein isoform X5 [Rhinoderma darwinii]|uniref:CD164 sialomucin-like 2 protein isoform X5 n=1 Tax=Rhinoderma darwinii TaxID=43563 RepID=UPI003F673147
MKRHDRRPGCAKNRGSRHQDYGRERCSQLNSCGTCIEGEPSLNISCEWVTCGTSENSSCVSKKEYEHESCTVTNSSSMCTDSPESKTESPPVFHTGSFIGGGILVILLQAVGYLVLKQLRGPERDYQTMEETPQ